MLDRRQIIVLGGFGSTSLGTLLASQAPSFRSSVNLVLLDVLVTDDAGRPVPGLERSNFRIKDQKRFVEVDRLTTGSTDLSIGLVLDYSRSMIHAQAKVVQAVEQLRTRLAPQDEAAIVIFNERVKDLLPLTLVGEKETGQRSGKWTTPLYKAKPDGQTALFDAIVQGAAMLKGAVHSRRAMLVLSDGKDTASKATKEDACRALMEANVLCYAIGLFHPGEFDTDSGALSTFADQTGGRAIFEPNVELLPSEFDRILEELRARYVIGFLASESEDSKGGELHKVKVMVAGSDGHKLRVRTRESFYLPGSEK